MQLSLGLLSHRVYVITLREQFMNSFMQKDLSGCLVFLTIGLFQAASIPVICALLIKIVKS